MDITKFERQSILMKSDFSKFYKFKEKETANNYAGQMSMMSIKQFLKDEIINVHREIDVFSSINHPNSLSWNEQKPVIVMELISNRTLDDILSIERMGKPIQCWDETKKLMDIYGTASETKYFHSIEIVHCCLQPSNIYLDDFLLPKNGDFGLSTRFYRQDNMAHQSM